MTCGNCAQNVRSALGKCNGIESVEVDVNRGVAIVKGHNFDTANLQHAVEDSGYKVSSMEESGNPGNGKEKQEWD